MSRHSFENDKHKVIVGVDRPLRYIFGQVWKRGSQDPRDMLVLGDPIEGYPPTEEGIDLILQDAAQYVKAPATVRDSLTHELELLATGGDLNIVKHHEIDP